LASSGTVMVHQKNSVLWAAMLHLRPRSIRISRPSPWKPSTDVTATFLAGMAPAGPLKSPPAMKTSSSVSFGRRRKLNGSISPMEAKSRASRGFMPPSRTTVTELGDLYDTVLPSAVLSVTSCGPA
jgi:hypothetical protein